MRILVLANVPPGLIGGAEVQALNLARCWALAGHETMVAGYANIPFSAGNLSIVRLPTIRINRLMRVTSYLAATLWFLWRNRRHYDVIYCRFIREQAFTACLAKILFRLSQPVIACPASSSTSGEVASILYSPLKLFLVWLLRKGLTVINAMTIQIEREVRALNIGNALISKIPNGVVLPKIDSFKNYHENKLRILFVGRLVELKGVDLLLQAINLLQNDRSKFTVNIVGDGPLFEVLADKIHELRLEDVVYLVGEVTPDNLSDYYQHADLFVLPSRIEGMSGALLEAIAYGLPSIATRVSGSDEIIDKSIGWLIPVDDIKALAEAIQCALNTDYVALYEMRCAARKKAEEKFDIERISVKYLDLFRNLCD